MKRLVLVLALAVAGCSSPAVGTVVHDAWPSSAVTPTVTAVPRSSDLGGLYTTIADKSNAKLDQCGKDMTAAGSDLAKAKVAAQECLDAENQYGADLGASRWGPVQAQIDDVIKSLGKVQILLGQMVGASDVTMFMSADNQLAAAEGDVHGAVNVLRSTLGLPPSA